MGIESRAVGDGFDLRDLHFPPLVTDLSDRVLCLVRQFIMQPTVGGKQKFTVRGVFINPVLMTENYPDVSLPVDDRIKTVRNHGERHIVKKHDASELARYLKDISGTSLEILDDRDVWFHIEKKKQC